MDSFPGLGFDDDGHRLVASIVPVEGRPPLDLENLRGLLGQAGYGEWPISEEVLDKLVNLYNTASVAFELPLGEIRDALFFVEISDDAMQAWLTITPASGGKGPCSDDVYVRLGEAGVTFGIDQAAVDAACASGSAEHILIAAGAPAVDGENARFELMISDARDRAPQMNEHGLIDFREQGAIPTVTKDQPLMRRFPATTGTAGRNVRGVPVEPKPGKDAPFDGNMVGAYPSANDSNVLLAIFSGQPLRCGNNVHVEPIYRVREVNLATGNISFDGTVQVEGEVLPGMKVHATGDILIGGVVDGAHLEAGGDIHVAGGIIAKSQVLAGGAVSARFVEGSQVLAGTTIGIEDTALQGDLQANNQIIVGIKSPERGRLAGGSARAMMLIRAPLLGSSTSGVTSLSLGVNPVLEAQYQDILHKVQKQKAEEENIEKVIKHLSKIGDKSGMLERAKVSWQQALKSWGALMAERDALEKQLALISEARVEVGVSLSGAVDMTFGHKTLHVRKIYETGSFSMGGDRVMFTDLVGNEIVAS